jgi:uncharacterized protein YcbK (DUF882 family)
VSARRDEHLTPSFRASEFRCRCRRPDCDAQAMARPFLVKLQALRDAYGKSLFVTSGARCPHWNRMVGGASHSQHLYGIAADLQPEDPADLPLLASLAEKVGMGGVGEAKNFIHVDDGPQGRRWTYD